MKFAIKNFAVETQENTISKSQVRTMLTCLFYFNGTATVGVSHKDQESIGPIVPVSQM